MLEFRRVLFRSCTLFVRSPITKQNCQSWSASKNGLPLSKTWIQRTKLSPVTLEESSFVDTRQFPRRRLQISLSRLSEPRLAPKPVVKIAVASCRAMLLQLVLSRCCLVRRESRSHTSFRTEKHSGSHATVPLIKRGAEHRRPETQSHTARRL